MCSVRLLILPTRATADALYGQCDMLRAQLLSRIVAVVAHLLACGFFLWPELVHGCSIDVGVSNHTHNCAVQDSWRDVYGLDGMPPEEQFLQSFYW